MNGHERSKRFWRWDGEERKYIHFGSGMDSSKSNSFGGGMQLSESKELALKRSEVKLKCFAVKMI